MLWAAVWNNYPALFHLQFAFHLFASYVLLIVANNGKRNERLLPRRDFLEIQNQLDARSRLAHAHLHLPQLRPYPAINRLLSQIMQIGIVCQPAEIAVS